MNKKKPSSTSKIKFENANTVRQHNSFLQPQKYEMEPEIKIQQHDRQHAPPSFPVVAGEWEQF